MSSISDLIEEAGEIPLPASLECQLESKVSRTTRTDKPYWELTLVDVRGNCKIKAWNNHPQFSEIENLSDGAFLIIEGEWTQNSYGLDSKAWSWAKMRDDQIDQFLLGDPELAKKQSQDWKDLQGMLAQIADPRLHALCQLFIRDFGDRFRRTAAAKKNHHARRGGLLEHVSQMARAAVALCEVYPTLNRDLLVSGILFHDCGKLWENCYPENSFAQTRTLAGELLSHIPLGMELVNHLWRETAQSEAAQAWEPLVPKSDEVRLHLLHLVASHHGTLEFGSPVFPKTPEAYIIHFIDNLDAKFEMTQDAYQKSEEISPGIYQRQFPLSAGLVAPLPSFQAPNDPSQSSTQNGSDLFS